jgi:outer membrane protein assembly factor BamD (BamD/ComL family)
MKHLRILMLLILAGCAGTPPDTEAGHPELRRAEAVAEAGRYDEAIEAYRKAAEQSQTEAAAEALFQSAYLLAYYRNPHRDYALARKAFEQYIALYPNGPRLEQAKNWRAVLGIILEQGANIARLNKTIEELKQIDIDHERKRDK